MRLSAVVWDVDGTLVDSEPLHLRALLLSCAKHNVDFSNIAHDSFIGMDHFRVWEALRDRYPPSMTIESWKNEIKANYRAHSGTLKEIPHAREIARQLANLGVPQAAVSNSNRWVVDENLIVTKLVGYMEFALSINDVPAGKPDPAPYNMAIARLGLSAGEVLVVEDSLPGIQSAKAAGAKVLHYAPDNVKALEADAVIRHLTEVPRHLTPSGTRSLPTFATV